MTNKSSSVESINWQAQASQYIEKEQYEQAASLYEQAITDEPEVKSYYWHLGLLLLLQGQETEAWTTWLLGIGDGEPQEVEVSTSELVQVLEAEAERRQGLADYQVAWTIRQYIRELSPSQINNLLQLIQLSIYLGNLTGEEFNSLGIIQFLRVEQEVKINSNLLLKVLQSLLIFLPFEPLTLEFAEVCLPHAARPQAFIDVMMRAAMKMSCGIKRLGEIVTHYQKTNQLDSSEAYFQKSNQFESAEAYCYLGNTLLNQSKLEEAVQCYWKALNLNPNFAEPHFNLAKIRVRQGKLDEAVESLDRVIALIPEWSIAHSFKANIIKSTLRIQSAIEYNSKENVNELYSNPILWKSDLLPETLNYYDDIIQIGSNKGIDYNGKHIADIGCGTGHLLLSLSRHYSPSSLTGFDFSPAALKVANEVIPQAKLTEFDIYKGTSQKFDIVFSTDTLEHLLYPERALKNLVAMLNEVGVAILAVPNGINDLFPGHINFWSPDSWKVFLESIGEEFEVETGLDTHDHNFAIIKRRG
jgi:tetratricopeptide (TPR) repeat protein